MTLTTASTRNQRLSQQNDELRASVNQLREELIRNRKENDELRKEIVRLKTLIQNRHLLLG